MMERHQHTSTGTRHRHWTHQTERNNPGPWPCFVPPPLPTPHCEATCAEEKAALALHVMI
jgi:hypothetical protein